MSFFISAINGFESLVKKLKQYFDERSNEHVFIIEYRFMKDDNPQQTKRDKEEKNRFNKLVVGDLVRSINSNISNNPNLVVRD
jgi:hypothetical protein